MNKAIIIKNIEAFQTDIYFKMPHELRIGYLDICTSISDFFDTHFKEYNDVLQQKVNLMRYLLELQEKNDFIKMADFLYYNVKPILEDFEYK